MGVFFYYYGRDWGLEFFEYVDIVLEFGMIIIMELMIVVFEGKVGVGGYREYDILIIMEIGIENIIVLFFIGFE